MIGGQGGGGGRGQSTPLVGVGEAVGWGGGRWLARCQSGLMDDGCSGVGECLCEGKVEGWAHSGLAIGGRERGEGEGRGEWEGEWEGE